ncbi:MAG: lipid-A-disaccharide synthase [Deltaproteobacteria bacterium]|nr:lipid-A-disaccharide synthase [Deltaproteobacteria bacterium]
MSPESQKNLFIIGGEESGDLHGSALLRELKEVMPGVRFEGMGGARMREAGLIGLDSKEVSVVGIVEIAEKLPALWKSYQSLKKRLARGGFDAAILIDFPDFNLRIAAEAGRLGIPVIYYISPQVWAWRKGRIKTIARLVKKMLVVFPFEEALYRKAGVDCEYVGHPLVDIAHTNLTKAEARRSLGIEADSTVVALLPGSRPGEVRRILGVMLEAASLVKKRAGKKIVFLLPAASSIDDSFLGEFLKESAVDARVVRNAASTALRAADAAAVTSGTATLEAAIIGTPMVIVYRMSPVSFVIGKLLVAGGVVGLPNIVAGRLIVPELLQWRATPANIADEIFSILTDRRRSDAMVRGFEEVRAALGPGGAARRAALAVKKAIGNGDAPPLAGEDAGR